MKARDALELIQQRVAPSVIAALSESKDPAAQVKRNFYAELKGKNQDDVLVAYAYSCLIDFLIESHGEKSPEVEARNRALFNDLLGKAKALYSEEHYGLILDLVFLGLMWNRKTPQYHYLFVDLLTYNPPLDKDGQYPMLYRVAQRGTPQIADLVIAYLRQRDPEKITLGLAFRHKLLNVAIREKNWRMFLYFFDLIKLGLDEIQSVDSFIANAADYQNEVPRMLLKLENSSAFMWEAFSSFFVQAIKTDNMHLARVLVESSNLNDKDIKGLCTGSLERRPFERFDCAYLVLTESDKRKAFLSLSSLLLLILGEFITSAPVAKLAKEYLTGDPLQESLEEEIRDRLPWDVTVEIRREDPRFSEFIKTRSLAWNLVLLDAVDRSIVVYEGANRQILFNQIDRFVGQHVQHQQLDEVLSLFKPVLLSQRMGAEWLDPSIRFLVCTLCQHLENSHMRFDRVARRILDEMKLEKPFFINDVEKNKGGVRWEDRYEAMMKLASCASLHQPWPRHCAELFEHELKNRTGVLSSSKRTQDQVNDLRSAAPALEALWAEERKSPAAVSAVESKSVVPMSVFSEVPDSFSMMWRYLKKQEAPLLLALFINVIKAIKENKVEKILSAMRLIFAAFECAPEFKEYKDAKNRFLNWIGVQQGELKEVINDCALRQGEVIFDLRREFAQFEKGFLAKNPEEKARLEEMLQVPLKKTVAPAVVARSAGPGPARA